MKTKVLQKQMDAGGGGRRAFMSRNSIKSLKSFLAIAALLLLSVNQVWGDTWTQVTSVSVGDQVVIAEIDDKTYELSGFTGTTVYGSGTEFTTNPAGTVTFTVVAGSSNGTFAFKNGDNYLRWNSGNSVDLAGTSVDANTSWTISTESERAKMVNANDDTRVLMWNKSSSRFACYTGKSHGNNSGSYYYYVMLYKKQNTTTYTDYLTECVSKTPLTKPTGLTVGTRTNTTVALSWTAGDAGNTGSYILEYKLSTAAEWTAVNNITATSYNLTGLTAGATYQWRVTAVPTTAASATKDNSDPASGTNFTTKTVLGTVTGLSAMGVSLGANLSWTAVANAAKYKVEYSADGDDWTVATSTVTTNSYSLSELSSCGEYFWRVTALANPSSEYVDGAASDGSDIISAKGYMVTVTATNVAEDGSNTYKSGTPTAFDCSNAGIALGYDAIAGYNLPSTVTVTIGGSTATADTDYEWLVDGTTAMLSIEKAKVTGAVNITVSGVSAGTKNIYMKAGAWNSDSPKFYAHSWGATDSDVEMTLVGCETDVYVAAIPVGNTSVLFTRQDGSSTAINWDYNDKLWNKSVDITIGSNDLFTFSSWNSGQWDSSHEKSSFTGGTYTAKTFTISFNKNEGTGADVASITNIPCNGSSAPLPANSLTRTGYDHNGWNTAADGSGTHYNNGQTVSGITANLELFAEWQKSSYTLSWNWGGGSCSGTAGEDYTTGSVLYGTTIKYPKNAMMSRDGYNFTGWSPNPSTMPAANTEIVAQWTAKAYSNYRTSCTTVTTVTLNKGDHGQANGTATIKLGASTFSSFTGVTPVAHFDLNGYYDGDTQVIDAEGHLVSNVSGWTTADGKWAKDETSATLTAKFTQRTFTVTTNDNGVATDHVINEGSSYALPALSCSNTDYTKVGWTTANPTGWNEGTSSPTITAVGTNISSAGTYYAVYSKQTGSGALTDNYQLITGAEFESGANYVILMSGTEYALDGEEYYDDNAFGTTIVTEKDGNVITEDMAKRIWTITGNSTDGFSIYTAYDGGGYVGYDYTNSHMEYYESSHTDMIVAFRDNVSDKVDFTVKNSDPTLYWYPSADDGDYYFTSSTTKSANVKLYKQVRESATTYYSQPDCRTVTGIEITTPPDKTTYSEGEYFDPNGMVIEVTYDQGDPTSVTYTGHESAFSFSPTLSTALTTSHDNVVVTYAGQSDNQGITVNAKVWRSVTFDNNNGEATHSGNDTRVEDGHTYNQDHTALPTASDYSWSSCDQGVGASTTFVGWTTTPIGVKQSECPTLITGTETISENKTYYAVWASGTAAMADKSLTSANMTGSANAYGTPKELTSDGYKWYTTGYQVASVGYMIQMKATTNSANGGYIQLPTFTSNIDYITVTVTDANATSSTGTATTTELSFVTEPGVYASIAKVATSETTYSNSRTLALPANSSHKTGYIVAGGSLRIWNVTVHFKASYSNYITHCLTPCETPTFSPVAGDYEGAQNVTISTTTAGATIYYTTDGTTPTTSSSVYNSAINVSANTTIKAIAVKDGMADSEVASATYNIVTVVANPEISAESSCFESSTNVTITCTTAGAAIYYTLDGSDPTSSGTRQSYSAPFTIDATKTVKAIATKSGLTSSSVVVKELKKKTVSSIVVKTASTKVKYSTCDHFDPAGLVITATYNCGDAADVAYSNETASAFTFSPSTSDPLTTSTTSVTITYGGQSTTQTIEVVNCWTVNWVVNGNSYTAGSPTTQVVNGGKVTTLPTAPASSLCDNQKVFVGWTNGEYTHASTAPSVLFTSAAASPTISAETTFYAVFANASQGGGGTVFHSESGTITSGDYYLIDTYTGAVDYQGVATSCTYRAMKGGLINTTSGGISCVNVCDYVSLSGNVLTLDLTGCSDANKPSAYTVTVSDGSVSLALNGTTFYCQGTNSVSADMTTTATGNHNWDVITNEDGGRHMLKKTINSDNRCLMVLDHTSSGNNANYCKMYALTNSNTGGSAAKSQSYGAGKLYFLPATSTTYTNYATTCTVCEHQITISKGTPSHGSFTLSVEGTQCIDAVWSTGTSTTLNATPDTHYYLSEVNVTGAGATVGEIVGNSCTITGIKGDVTITPVFAEAESHNIAWMVNGADAEYSGQDYFLYQGDSFADMTLPTAPDNDALYTACGSVARKFMGWSTTDVGWAMGGTAPSILFTTAEQAGTQLGTMGSEDVTFYAVYAEGVATTWEQFVADGSKTTCDFVIAVIPKSSSSYYWMPNITSTGKAYGTDRTEYIVGGVVSASDATGYKKTFEKLGDGKYLIYDGTKSYGAVSDATDFQIGNQKQDTEGYKWTVSNATYGSYRITNVQATTRGLIASDYTFGAYATNNVTASQAYRDCELLPIATGVYQNYMTKCCPTPAAPTSLNATPAVDGGTVYWTKSANATAYEVQVNGGEWTNVGDVNNYTISGLACGGTAVNWYVRAKNNCYTSTAANHAFYTAQCNCDGFQFHYRDFSGNWNTNNVCFSAVAGTDHDQLTEEFALPYANAFNVSWQGSPLSDSKTKTTDFQYMGYFLQNSKNFGVNPQNGNMGGALGKMHIYDNSGSDNMYVQWIPTGYTLQMGDGTNWPTTYNFTGKTTAWNETEWLTDLVTVTDAQIGGKIYVGLKTTNGYVWCGTYSEVIDLNGLRTKAGADDSWVSGGLSTAYANKTGKFRIYANSGDKNWYVTFVPHLQLTYNANGGSGEMAGSDWRSVELDDAGRKVTVAANGFTAPDGQAFKGWNTNAAGTGDWINVANDWVLRENISNVLYAIWDQKYPVRYTGSTSGEIDHYEVAGATVDIKDDPVEVGYTFNGWTVTDDHANNIAVNGSSNNYYFTMPADGVTVHANMTANVTNLTYYDMGGAEYSGTNRPSLPDTHTYGSPTILPAGVKAGYEFGGWHLLADCSDAAIAELSASVDYGSSLSIYTKWTKASTVTFIDHSDIVSSSEVAEGSEIPFPVSPDCELYTFLGWAETGVIAETTTDPGLTYYKQGDHVAMGSSAKTFRAVYSKLEGEAGYRYDKITSGVTKGNYVLIDQTAKTSGFIYTQFNVNGYGDVTSLTLPENCTTLDETAIPNDAEILQIEVSGSNFSMYDGYKNVYLKGMNGNGIASNTTKIYDWKLTTDSDVNGNTCPAGAINSVNYSTRVLQYVSTGGNRFAGYENTQKNWVYLFKQVEKGTRYYATEPECIAPMQITVMYDANGQAGTTLPANTALDYNPYPNFNTYNVGHATDVTGWHFSKWNTQSNGLGTDYAADAEVTTFGGGDAITLYAQWETVYTVTKHDNGATTPIVQTGAGAAIDLGTGKDAGHCDKEGGFDWTFVGWTTSSTPLAEYPVCPTLIANPSAYVPAENVDVYAVYSRPITNTTAFSSGVSGAYIIKDINAEKYLGSKTNGDPFTFNAVDNSASAIPVKLVFKNNKYNVVIDEGVVEWSSSTSLTFAANQVMNDKWTIAQYDSKWYIKYGSESRWLGYNGTDKFNAQNSNTYVTFTPATGTYYYSNPVCQDGYNITFTQVGGTVNYGSGKAEDYQGLTGGATVTTFPTIDLRGDLMDWAFVGWSTTDYNTQHAGSLDDEGASVDAPAGAIYRTDGPNTFTMPNTNVTLYPVFTSMKANEPLDLEDGGDYYIYFTSDNQAGFRDPYYAIDGHTIRVYAQQVSGTGAGSSFSSTQHCANAQMFHFEQRETGKWNIRLRNSAGDGYISNSYLTNPGTQDNALASQGAEPEGYWTIEQQPNGSFKAQYSVNAGTHYFMKGLVSNPQTQASATFKCYSQDCDNSNQFYAVYLGSCEERTFSSNPNPQPDLRIEGVVNITSRKGDNIAVRGAQTLTLQGIRLTEGETITITSNNADVYFSTTTAPNFTKANKPMTSVDVTVPADGNVNMPIYVHYKPSTNVDGIETVNVTVSASVHTLLTSEVKIHCRHLPDQFVIAAKVGTQWYALPANMTAADNPLATPITVNEATMVAEAPTNCAYMMWPVKTTSTTGDRYEAAGEAVRFAAVKDSAALWASDAAGTHTTINNSAKIKTIGSDVKNPNYEWAISTSDLKVYTLTATGDNNQANLVINRPTSGGKKGQLVWGTYGTSETSQLYLLPFTTFTDMQATVVEWFRDKVLVDIDSTLWATMKAAGTTSNSRIGDGEWSAAADVDYTTYGTKLCVFNTGSLLNQAGNQLSVKVTVSETDYQTNVEVPIIVSYTNKSVTDAPFSTLSAAKYNNMDLVVRDGAHLNANGTLEQNTFRNVTIYPTSKLRIDDGYEFQATGQITLRGGKDEIYDGKGSYAMTSYGGEPQLYAMGNLYHESTPAIYYEKRVDLAKMYQVSLPGTVPLSNITYLDGTVIKPTDELYAETWNGQAAANEVKTSHWIYEDNPLFGSEMKIGVGYVVSCEPQYAGQNYSIIRFPMTKHKTGDSEAAFQEYVDVTYWQKQGEGPKRLNSAGWNYIGNPYMTSLKGSIYIIPKGKTEEDKVELEYITYMSPDGSMYYVGEVAKTTMLPFRSYFVQDSIDGKLLIASNARQAEAPARKRTMEDMVKYYLALQQGTTSDSACMRISESYSDQYVIGKDAEKLSIGPNTSVYFIDKNGNLAYDAVKPAHASNWIPVGFYAPSKGEMTFWLNVEVGAMNIKHIYLKDKETLIQTDLLTSGYTFSTDKTGQIGDRFEIMVEFGNTPTDIDGASESDSDKIRKFVYEDKLFIEKNGIIYDATGKRVKL